MMKQLATHNFSIFYDTLSGDGQFTEESRNYETVRQDSVETFRTEDFWKINVRRALEERLD